MSKFLQALSKKPKADEMGMRDYAYTPESEQAKEAIDSFYADNERVEAGVGADYSREENVKKSLRAKRGY